MHVESWKLYIENEKEKYKKMGYAECPAFLNERVYFNNYGFHHILFKNGIPRPQDEIVKRFYLLKYVPNLLKVTKYIDKEEKRIKNKSVAYFWTIKNKLGPIRIRIILRRLGVEGKLHFFSVMEE